MIQIEHCISKSVLGGILISIGGLLTLICTNKTLSSVLVSVCLLSVILLGFNSLNSKSGFITDSKDLRRLTLVLGLNLFTAFIFGLLIRFSIQDASSAADAIVKTRLDTSYLDVIIKSIITGFLITTAVTCYDKDNGNRIISLLCIFAFIVVDCNHCILDTFYYSASTIVYNDFLLLLLQLVLVTVFNFVGCILHSLFINKRIMHLF